MQVESATLFSNQHRIMTRKHSKRLRGWKCLMQPQLRPFEKLPKRLLHFFFLRILMRFPINAQAFAVQLMLGKAITMQTPCSSRTRKIGCCCTWSWSFLRSGKIGAAIKTTRTGAGRICQENRKTTSDWTCYSRTLDTCRDNSTTSERCCAEARLEACFERSKGESVGRFRKRCRSDDDGEASE